jgi:hypothetical protein
LSAIATANNYGTSADRSLLYSLVQAATPAFNPPSGPIANGTAIAISCATPGSTIFYTIDGTPPTTNSTIYTGPILFTNQLALQAQAFANGHLPSGTASVFYGLVDFITNVSVTTFAGSPTAGHLDGMGGAAQFSLPEGICMDTNGNLFVADTGNNCIRKILPTGQVITYAGNGSITNSQSPSATNAFFNGPVGVCLDSSGNLYVADGGNNNRICKIGTDGSFAVYAYVRPGYAAGFGQLIADPAGNLYAGNWAEVYEIFTNGSVQALAGTSCACPGGWGLGVSLGLVAGTNLYAATSDYVWKVTRGQPDTLIAGGSAPQFSDGPALQAGFDVLTGVAVDPSGNIYLSDSVRIRKLSPSGWVSTVAGTGVADYVDGPGTAARFNGVFPWYLSSISQMGLCLDSSGNLYVADTANNCIRKVSFNTVALPRLQLSLSSNQITIAWPAWATDFVLESSGAYPPGWSWSTVTNGAILLQGGTTFVWTNQIGVGRSFYRLHKP